MVRPFLCARAFRRVRRVFQLPQACRRGLILGAKTCVSKRGVLNNRKRVGGGGQVCRVVHNLQRPRIHRGRDRVTVM